ncbi:uncharacterized protein LOC127104044 [Lathyrus oleraceus]|uniref:uncharacterized protein LOC127104044 n=1 Tax=Pisum sativum TaxID=3888 RepID=UPI0021D00C3E|nr:uncharacterized protein LOC127104044 [Pisum sativum]
MAEPHGEAPPPPAERLLGDYGGANAPTGRLTIVNQPKEGESLGDAYKRFKRLLVACPTHNMDATEHMQNFVNGLRMKTKQLIDTVAGGSTNFTTATRIKKLIEAIAANEHLELYDRSVSQPKGIIDLKLANQVVKMEDQITAEVERRLKKMTLDTQTVAQVQPVQPIQAVSCEICGGPHFAMHCVATAQQVEEINFLKQNNPYSNTYNPGWKNHPNFSWKDQQGNAQKQMPTQYQSQPQQQYRPQQQQPYQQQQFHPSQQQFQQQVPRKADWEIAIEKMATQSSQFQVETKSALPSATVTNPREHNNVSDVTTRSGKAKEVPEKDDEQEDQLLEVDLEIKENEVVSEKVTVFEPVAKEKVSESKSVVKLPFPTRNKKKEKHEKNFEKFLEMFKKIEINIPFLKALEKMPSYAKFMKDILSKKRSTDTDSIVLTETCSAILQEMPEDEEIPLILGRPFLETGRCLIDIEEGTMTLKVYDEELKIDVHNTIKYKDDVATSQHIEVIDQMVLQENHLGEQKSPLDPKSLNV